MSRRYQQQPRRVPVSDNPAPDFIVVVPEGSRHYDEFESKFVAAWAENRNEPKVLRSDELEDALRSQP